jgi:hypothetical protein
MLNAESQKPKAKNQKPMARAVLRTTIPPNLASCQLLAAHFRQLLSHGIENAIDELD